MDTTKTLEESTDKHHNSIHLRLQTMMLLEHCRVVCLQALCGTLLRSIAFICGIPSLSEQPRLNVGYCTNFE